MADEGLEAAQAKLAAIESGLMRDAVRKEAVSHGLIDPSDIDHISLDGIALGPNGTVTGVKEVVQNFKTNKPHWFRTTGSGATRIPASVKPGSPEARQAEQDFISRYSR